MKTKGEMQKEWRYLREGMGALAGLKMSRESEWDRRDGPLVIALGAWMGPLVSP